MRALWPLCNSHGKGKGEKRESESRREGGRKGHRTMCQSSNRPPRHVKNIWTLCRRRKDSPGQHPFYLAPADDFPPKSSVEEFASPEGKVRRVVAPKLSLPPLARPFQILLGALIGGDKATLGIERQRSAHCMFGRTPREMCPQRIDRERGTNPLPKQGEVTNAATAAGAICSLRHLRFSFPAFPARVPSLANLPTATAADAATGRTGQDSREGGRRIGPIISSNQRHKSHHLLHEAGSSRGRLQRDHRP